MARCAALSVSGVKERRNSVIAGKFAADFTEEIHAMMKEYAAHDALAREAIALGDITS
jgi:hypothetical protein